MFGEDNQIVNETRAIRPYNVWISANFTEIHVVNREILTSDKLHIV